MRYTQLIFILSFGILCSHTIQAEPTRQLRIINGEDVQSLLYPWMVSIHFKSGSIFTHGCGGSLINSTWVLTAAHCVKSGSINETPETTKVYANFLRQSETSSDQAIAVKQIVIHPDWDEIKFHHDLALLELETPITNITPLALNSSSHTSYLPENGTVTGWGYTRQRSPSSQPDVLQQVSLPLVDNATCQTAYSQFSGIAITEDQLCAGFVTGGKDACQNDSGGPLFVQYGHKWVQVGIVSFGNFPDSTDYCAGKDSYGVYTRLSQYHDYIRSVVGEIDTLPVGEAHLSADGQTVYLPQIQWQTDPVQSIWAELQRKTETDNQYSVINYGVLNSESSQPSAELSIDLQLTINRLVWNSENNPRYTAVLHTIPSDGNKPLFQLQTATVLQE